jgi:hypothetical protein
VTAALGTYGDSATPPLVRQGRRAGREALKRAQRALTESVSSALCWYCAGTGAVVDIGAALTAHVSGIRRCGSPWACLMCAPTVRERRATEIDSGVATLLAMGGCAVFVTVTLPHGRFDPLEPRLAAITEALHYLLQGSAWQRRKSALGFVGAIRSVEVTYGRNGWHPHNHALLLFDRLLTDAELADLEAWLSPRWRAGVERLGFGTTNHHGVDVRPVTEAAALSSYLCKVDGGWGVGLEMARTDVKRNSPLQHLRDFATTGDMASARLWREYETATFGKRAIRWSPGLRRRLLGDETETADAELAASEGIDLALMRAVVPREVWDPAVHGGTASDLLRQLEQIAALILTMTVNPQPLEVPRGAHI